MSEQRVIDANALWMDIIHSMDYCDDILEIIERQPTIEERKTGKWISLDDFRGLRNTLGYKCSECNEQSDYEENFCPNCGARMVQEGEEP